MSTDNNPTQSGGGPPAHPESHHATGRTLMVVACIITLVVVLIIGILPRIKQKEALAQGVKQVKSSQPEVTVTKPKWYLDPGVSLPANIQAIKATVINARTDGFLSKLFVDIGSHVTEGQVLGIIQSPDVDQQLYQAQAQTAQSRATVLQSKANVASQQATVAQDQAEVARQKFMVQQAKQAVAVANAQLAQSEAAEKGANSGVLHAQQALNVQKAALRQSESQRDLARVTNQRYQNLVAQGFDSQQDADTAAASYKVSLAAVESAQAAVDAAQADIETAVQNLGSAKSAVIASKANVESAIENVSAADASLTSAAATVDSAKHAVRASAETVNANQSAVTSNVFNQKRFDVMRGFEKLVAPFTGVITARNVDVGTLISSGGTETGVTTPAPLSGILGIARTDVVRIQVNVPQTYVPAISQGSTAKVTVKELPGKTFSGVVTMRAGALDTTSRTQLIEIHISNPTNVLVPGMYAEVRIVPDHPARTLHIAGTALIVDAAGTRVAIVNPDKSIHMQKVVVGRDFGSQIEILSGLQGNETLVNTPSDILQEGQKVTVLKPQAAKGDKKAAGPTKAPEDLGGIPEDSLKGKGKAAGDAADGAAAGGDQGAPGAAGGEAGHGHHHKSAGAGADMSAPADGSTGGSSDAAGGQGHKHKPAADTTQ